MEDIYRPVSGPDPQTPNILDPYSLPKFQITEFHLYREDARNNGAGNANGLTILHELEKGFWSEEKLCNDEVCSSKDFLLQVPQVCFIALCFRMTLGVAFEKGRKMKNVVSTCRNIQKLGSIQSDYTVTAQVQGGTAELISLSQTQLQ